MVDKYLDRGKMYVLFQDDTAISECVVTDEGNKILEIKNLATNPDFQHQGYAQKLVEFIEQKYRGQFDILQVGTGDSPLTLPFYEKILDRLPFGFCARTSNLNMVQGRPPCKCWSKSQPPTRQSCCHFFCVFCGFGCPENGGVHPTST